MELRPENISPSGKEQLLALARNAGVLRARDLGKYGIARAYLRPLVEEGFLERVGRGLYALADLEPTEHQTLREAMVRVPNGVICLASALRYHGLTTQNPRKVWLQIESRSRIPKVDHPPLIIVRASGVSFTEGVEIYDSDGIRLHVTSVARTVADCFKYRSTIGLDVALEALKQCLIERRASRDEIRRFARLCRVERVMTPYLEAYTI